MVDLQTCGRVYVSTSEPSWCGDLKVEILETPSTPDGVALPDTPRIETPDFSNWISRATSTEETQAKASGLDEASMPHIEGFQINGLLGQGGMGIVWRAVQLSTGRAVALKLMRGGMFGSVRARARFEREVELLARLDHPNIARLYESGIREGIYFYAMELVDGIPLDQFVRNQQRSLHQTLELMERVCRAVDHAHRRGIIHRDLKPGNILVTSDGRPKVVDFGLARLLATEDHADVTRLSLEGSVAGTLVYMSPEQATGEFAQLDTRTDVYSLGVILYELATGDLPHQPGASQYDLQRRIIQEDPVPPRRIDRRIDRELEAIILRAMRRDAEERYSAAAGLADDLHRYLVGDPLHARPLTLSYVVRKRLAQHKARLAVVLVALVLALGGAGAAYLQIMIERNRAEAHAQQTEQALYQHRLLLAKSEIEQGNVGHALELLHACPEALRHWEWRYLRHQADSSKKTIQVSGGRLLDMAVDSASGLVRTLTDKGYLQTWRLSDGEPLTSRGRWLGDVEMAALSVDGRAILTYQAGKFELLDTQDESRRSPLAWQGASPVRLAGSSGGAYWAIADDAGDLTLVDGGTGDVVWTIELPATCSRLRFSEAGDLAVAAGRQIAWTSISVEAPSVLRWQETQSRAEALAFSTDGQMLAAGDQAGVAYVWRRDTDEPISQFVVDRNEPLLSLAFDADGTRLINGSRKRMLSVWDWEQATLIGHRRGHTASPRSLRVCQQSGTVISADMRDQVKFWQIGNEIQTISLPASPTSFIIQIGWQPEGAVLASIGDGTQIWAAIDSRPRLIASFPEQTTAVAFSGSNRIAALGTSDSIELWQFTENGRSMKMLRKLPAGKTRELVFCAAGELIAGVIDDQVHVWRVTTGQEIFRARTNGIIAFDERNNRLLARAPDRTDMLIVWDIQTSQPVDVFEAPAEVLAVTLDGSRVATALAGGKICIWTNGDPKPVHQWNAYGSAEIHGLAFTPDGQRLATAGPSIKLWDPATGSEMLEWSANGRTHFRRILFRETDETLFAGTYEKLMNWSWQ